MDPLKHERFSVLRQQNGALFPSMPKFNFSELPILSQDVSHILKSYIFQSVHEEFIWISLPIKSKELTSSQWQDLLHRVTSSGRLQSGRGWYYSPALKKEPLNNKKLSPFIRSGQCSKLNELFWVLLERSRKDPQGTITKCDVKDSDVFLEAVCVLCL